MLAVVAIVAAGAMLPDVTPAADGLSPLLAQENTAPPTAPNIVIQGRNYILDAILVAVFFGGAIFAIARTSRRS